MKSVLYWYGLPCGLYMTGRGDENDVLRINSTRKNGLYMESCQALVRLTACHLFGTKPLSEPMLKYYQLDPKDKLQRYSNQNLNFFIWRNCTWKCRPKNGMPQCIISTNVSLHSPCESTLTYLPTRENGDGRRRAYISVAKAINIMILKRIF